MSFTIKKLFLCFTYVLSASFCSNFSIMRFGIGDFTVQYNDVYKNSQLGACIDAEFSTGEGVYFKTKNILSIPDSYKDNLISMAGCGERKRIITPSDSVPVASEIYLYNRAYISSQNFCYVINSNANYDFVPYDIGKMYGYASVSLGIVYGMMAFCFEGKRETSVLSTGMSIDCLSNIGLAYSFELMINEYLSFLSDGSVSFFSSQNASVLKVGRVFGDDGKIVGDSANNNGYMTSFSSGCILSSSNRFSLGIFFDIKKFYGSKDLSPENTKHELNTAFLGTTEKFISLMVSIYEL